MEILLTSRVAFPHKIPEQLAERRFGGLQLVEGGQTETDGFLWGPPLHVVETADGGRVPAGGSQGVDRVRGNPDHLALRQKGRRLLEAGSFVRVEQGAWWGVLSCLLYSCLLLRLLQQTI